MKNNQSRPPPLQLLPLCGRSVPFLQKIIEIYLFYPNFFPNRRSRFMPKNTKCILKNLERTLETAVPPIQVTAKVYS